MAEAPPTPTRKRHPPFHPSMPPIRVHPPAAGTLRGSMDVARPPRWGEIMGAPLLQPQGKQREVGPCVRRLRPGPRHTWRGCFNNTSRLANISFDFNLYSLISMLLLIGRGKVFWYYTRSSGIIFIYQ